MHYEPVPYRPAQVNARFDLGFAVGLMVVIIASRRLSGGISGAPRRRLVGAAYRPRRGRRLDSAACPYTRPSSSPASQARAVGPVQYTAHAARLRDRGGVRATGGAAIA